MRSDDEVGFQNTDRPLEILDLSINFYSSLEKYQCGLLDLADFLGCQVILGKALNFLCYFWEV